MPRGRRKEEKRLGQPHGQPGGKGRKRAKGQQVQVQTKEKVQTKRSETTLLPPGNPNVPAPGPGIRVRPPGPAGCPGSVQGEPFRVVSFTRCVDS